MTKQRNRELSLTRLFTAFFFLQLTVLRMGNGAGVGYLEPSRQEQVYYVLQVFAILGFLSYAFLRDRTRRAVTYALLVLFCAGGAVLLFAGHSRLYLNAAFATVFCLGYLGGGVYHRMSLAAAMGTKTGRCMGFGCACSVGLQYLLQLWRGTSPLLAPVMVLALVLLAAGLREELEAPEAEPPRTTGGTLVFACLIAAVLILLPGFYNGYIHHLQIASGYTDYNVYSWPRLILIPCYLLFGYLGDIRDGKLVPAATLCVSLAGLLNSVLVGSAGADQLNMCLYYCAIAAAVTYYNLTFWRLAPGTKHPALLASMGRMLDSGLVLLAGCLRLSLLPAPAVLALDVVGIAAVILLMAASGDLSFSRPVSAPVPAAEPGGGPDPLEEMRTRYGLTPAEVKVLRELVLTEDKQAAIAQRLDIKVGTVQYHTTALYRKTGASTRTGLHELYHRAGQKER